MDFFDLSLNRKGEDLIFPCCKNTLKNESLTVRYSVSDECRVEAKCIFCNEIFQFKLPELSKPLIFLDQWLVSNLFQSNDKNYELIERVVYKLEKLKFIQRVVIVSSDIDAAETSRIPVQYREKCESIWKKVIDLSESHVLHNRDLLCGQIEKSLGLVSRSQVLIDRYRRSWIVGHGKHSLRLLMTKSWMIDLERLNPVNHLDDEFINLFNQQSQLLELQPLVNFEASLKVVKEHCKQGFIDAIKVAALELERNSLDLSIAEDDKLLEITEEISKLTNDYSDLICEIILNYEDTFSIECSINLLNKLNSFVEKDVFIISDYLEVENYLRAERLLHYFNNRYKKVETKTFKKTASVKYGVSRMNDIARVAAALPYASVLLVDSDVERILNESDLHPIRNKYSQCNVFSLASIDSFELWLDDLLQSQEVSDELRIVRRLVCGPSPIEEALETESIIQEIIDSLLAGKC